MRTIRRLIYREVLAAVVFVAVGFLALFFFFDFVDELPNASKAGGAYRLTQALAYVTLLVPSHLYELLPIAVLIGTIFVMARLAQSSEYTILRTSGLGPWRALRTLLTLGLMFTLLTFAVGDYLAPVAGRTAQLLKARLEGRISIGQTGAWLKERQPYNTYNVNVGALTPGWQHAGRAHLRVGRAGLPGVRHAGAQRPLRGRRRLAAGRRGAQRIHVLRQPTSRRSSGSRCPRCAGPPRSRRRWCPWRCSSPTA